jgi:hypothetical protein
MAEGIGCIEVKSFRQRAAKSCSQILDPMGAIREHRILGELRKCGERETGARKERPLERHGGCRQVESETAGAVLRLVWGRLGPSIALIISS